MILYIYANISGVWLIMYFTEKREERTRAKRIGEKTCCKRGWNGQRRRIVENIRIAFDLWQWYVYPGSHSQSLQINKSRVLRSFISHFLSRGEDWLRRSPLFRNILSAQFFPNFLRKERIAKCFIKIQNI